MANLANELVERIRSVVSQSPLGNEPRPVNLHEPEIDELEKKYVLECLDSTFVSSVGAFIPQLEQRIQDITGAKHAIAVSNGTVGLQVALFLAGVEYGDEVIVPTDDTKVESRHSRTYFFSSSSISGSCRLTGRGSLPSGLCETTERMRSTSSLARLAIRRCIQLGGT